MFNKLDTIKMIALGRNFNIGTLYNHIEDVIVPSKSKFSFSFITERQIQMLFKMDNY